MRIDKTTDREILHYIMGTLNSFLLNGGIKEHKLEEIHAFHIALHTMLNEYLYPSDEDDNEHKG